MEFSSKGEGGGGGGSSHTYSCIAKINSKRGGGGGGIRTPCTFIANHVARQLESHKQCENRSQVRHPRIPLVKQIETDEQHEQMLQIQHERQLQETEEWHEVRLQTRRERVRESIGDKALEEQFSCFTGDVHASCTIVQPLALSYYEGARH